MLNPLFVVLELTENDEAISHSERLHHSGWLRNSHVSTVFSTLP